MLTSPAQRAPRPNLVAPIVLGIILVPVPQFALGILGLREASLLPWLVGTPICYFLIGGLGAFIMASGLVPAQARRSGSFVGLLAGIGGACSAGVVLAAIAVWDIVATPESASLLHPHAGITPRLSYIASGPSLHLPLIVFIILLVPFFLGLNLLGV